MLKIRRPLGRLIFNMGIAIPGKTVFLIETAPWCWNYVLYDVDHAWWRHQMETFSALLAICAGNSPVNSPHKGQWRRALMFSLICVWISGWVNNRGAGDLRRYRAHYDVNVIGCPFCYHAFSIHDTVIVWWLPLCLQYRRITTTSDQCW